MGISGLHPYRWDGRRNGADPSVLASALFHLVPSEADSGPTWEAGGTGTLAKNNWNSYSRKRKTRASVAVHAQIPSWKNSATPNNQDASFAGPRRLMVSKTLADATRCQVLEAIYRAGPLKTEDLSRRFHASHATISVSKYFIDTCFLSYLIASCHL